MNGNHSEDGAWIRGALERFEGPLLLYAGRILRDADRARDVVQETFLRLCGQERARVEPALAEWLYTVCRNHALDVVRKEKRMNPITETQAEAAVSPAEAPPDALERRDSEDRVLRALDGLPANQQEVIRLKFQHDLSYKEISRVTNRSVSNVGFLIHAGVKRIRERLGEAALS